MTLKLTREQAALLRLISDDSNHFLDDHVKDIAHFPGDALHGLVWHDVDSFGLSDAGREALEDYDARWKTIPTMTMEHAKEAVETVLRQESLSFRPNMQTQQILEEVLMVLDAALESK